MMKPRFLSFLLVALCLWAFGCEESEESSDISMEDVEVSKDDVKEVTKAPDSHETGEEEDLEDEEEIEECCTDEGCREVGSERCDQQTCECVFEETCCTQAECEMNHICDYSSCECIPHGDPCFELYCVCDPAEAQMAGFTCVEFEGDFITMAYCESTSLDTHPCPEGTVCIEEYPGEGGACYPHSCELLSDDCPEEEQCTRHSDGLNHCTPTGTTGLGLHCTVQENCAAGLLCVQAAPLVRTTCETLCALENPEGCPEGTHCEPLYPQDGVGFCAK